MVSRAGIVVAVLASCGCAAADLGTLFHTPEERAQLDRQRRGEPPEAVAAPGAETRTPAVTGYVRRSDGRHTVWVDGTPLATRNDPRTFDPRTLPPRGPAAPPEKPEAPPARGEAKPPALPAPPPKS